jgi:transcriptional regulator with XRE-family HTH domain
MGRRRIADADRAFRTEVARKFRAAMQTRRLNQAAAARELNVTRQALSQYLLEKTTPQGEILARACAKWGIRLLYRTAEFGRGAFAPEEGKSRPEVFQMDLFREPQVFENANLVVTLERSQRATLQVTIRMKKADSTPEGPATARTARQASRRESA